MPTQENKIINRIKADLVATVKAAGHSIGPVTGRPPGQGSCGLFALTDTGLAGYRQVIPVSPAAGEDEAARAGPAVQARLHVRPMDSPPGRGETHRPLDKWFSESGYDDYCRAHRRLVGWFRDEEVTDILQEAMVKLTSLLQYRKRHANIQGLFWKVVGFAARQHARVAARRRKHVQFTSAVAEPASSREGDDPVAALVEHERRLAEGERLARIHAAIDALPERYRQVMLLCIAGMKTHQIADQLGVTHGVVKGVRARARKKLKAALAEPE